MAQPITDYAGFFIGAKQAVQELDELKQKEKLLLDLEKQLENSLKTKKKEIAETIALTVKKRSDEITKSYDTEIGKTQDRIKKIRSKREKAKNQGEKERIAEETEGLMKENEELNVQVKTIFHANHVPAFCKSGLYYSLFFTKGITEFMTLLITLLICFLAVPVGAYFAIPDRKTWMLIAIYVAAILIFGGLYVVVGNTTKMKHMDALKEGRIIRNKIKANKKLAKKIEKSIRKDKDEAVYNLQLFDDEIAQLEQNVARAERQKREALNAFNSVTKTIISDEISGNHKAEIDQLENDFMKTTSDLKVTQNALMAKALYITDNYEIYAGKEFMTVEKLSALEEIINSGKATNITDAISVFRNKDYNKKA